MTENIVKPMPLKINSLPLCKQEFDEMSQSIRVQIALALQGLKKDLGNCILEDSKDNCYNCKDEDALLHYQRKICQNCLIDAWFQIK